MHQDTTVNARKTDFKIGGTEVSPNAILAALALSTLSFSACRQKEEFSPKNTEADSNKELQALIESKPSHKSISVNDLSLRKQEITKALDEIYIILAHAIVYDLSANRQLFVDYYNRLEPDERQEFIAQFTKNKLNSDAVGDGSGSPDTGLMALRILCAMSEDISGTTRQMYQQGRLEACDQYLAQVSKLKFDQIYDPATNAAAVRAEGVFRLADQLELRDHPSVKKCAETVWRNLESAEALRIEDDVKLNLSYPEGLKNVLYYNFNM